MVLSENTRKNLAWAIDLIGTIVLILTLLSGLLSSLIANVGMVEGLITGASLKALGVGLYVKAK